MGTPVAPHLFITPGLQHSNTPFSELEPLVGLAPTNTSLRNSPCGC